MSQKWKSVLMFGPPGSGKGTQGKLLCMAGNHYHFSSGDMFRSLDPDSKEGKLFFSYMKEGKLGPDNLTIDIWKNYIEKLVAEAKYNPDHQLLFLDGIPRTKLQTEMIEEFIEVKKIILLEIPNEDILVDRILKRALKEGREDDANEDVIRERLAIYHKQTKAVLDHYPENLVCKVNGDQKQVLVLKSILNAISNELV